ncbi:MAG: ABC transporter ATP-binding protein [Thermanaerothrix sp.]|uniref:ABC transporter ATP-binding protein n=2 Tax=Thermanaerothrix TaxID=1077886 RepID=A0ABU3NL71_9CHLR|nr:ABC transporter ATP-binding protein [Thermanaerothrix sp. 4228-RoL]MDT8897590.1 ABC transporter ATP-binding protein [Thermanaerothrix sp. 4228-RoL]
MLKLDNVSKVYRVGAFGGKALYAVNNVSFEVQKGEVVSLIGESGSGKSTIGKMILRLLNVTDGKITFNGTDISTLEGEALKEYYRQVQGVFQDPFSSYNPIFKADRIFKVLHEEFFPEVPGAEWQKRVEHALSSVGLNPMHVLNKYPHQLSGGQLQRFLIARALLLDIQFLVADEIISMLDASTRIDVLNLLADLKSRGLSILFITHDLSLAYYISERAVILYKGYVVEQGAVERIFHTPLHPYTRMLMESVPRLDRKWEKGVTLLERKIEEFRNGCPYFERCPVAEKLCAVYRPPLIEVETDHAVACIHYQSSSEVQNPLDLVPQSTRPTSSM